MTTWLQRIKKMLATPPQGTTPGAAETEFQQRARELLQSESGANTLKDILLSSKPEVGTSSAQRRSLWEKQLDHVQGVLHAFAAERSIDQAKATRTAARADIASAERSARTVLGDLQTRRTSLAADLQQLQARLAPLERVAEDSEQVLRKEHDLRVEQLNARLAEAEGANDAAAADAASNELSTELRHEAERRGLEQRAPHPAALRAKVLRDSCTAKAAELATLEAQQREAERALAHLRLDAAEVDYHEGVAMAMLASAQATAEVMRWRGDSEAMKGGPRGRLDRLELDLVVGRPELVPCGDRMRAYRPDASRWPVDDRLIATYLMPLYAQLDMSIFARDTTRKWPDELELERTIAAENAAAAAAAAKRKAEQESGFVTPGFMA
jgi:hypothetical protein